METIKKLLIVFLGFSLVSACGDNHSQSPSGGNNINSSDELPFNEQFNLNIKLPISNEKFLEILKERGLDYTLIGDRGSGVPIPNPRTKTDINIDKITKVYQVYGGIDKNNRFNRIYRAYLSSDGMIVLIENTFEYPGM